MPEIVPEMIERKDGVVLTVGSIGAMYGRTDGLLIRSPKQPYINTLVASPLNCEVIILE